MLGFFKKTQNSLKFPLIVAHMYEQQEKVRRLFNLDPYNNLDEVITLYFYFERDILSFGETTNYNLNTKIHFDGGINLPLSKVLAELGIFFHQVSESMKDDKVYMRLVKEVSGNPLLYNDLNNFLPKNFRDFQVYQTELMDMYFPLSLNMGFD